MGDLLIFKRPAKKPRRAPEKPDYEPILNMADAIAARLQKPNISHAEILAITHHLQGITEILRSILIEG